MFHKILLKISSFLILFSTFPSLLLAQTPHRAMTFNEEIKKVESDYGGTLSLAALDTSNNALVGHNARMRVAMCSVFKFMLVGAILNESLENSQLLNEVIHYTKEDMVNAYSPYTKKNIVKGMTIAELCRAAILSDNTAANLLLKRLGGLKVLNRFARSIGDNYFRLDRREPNLNTAIPGDKRDTSTPRALVESLKKLALGFALGERQKKIFIQWLKGNTTGGHRIKSGVPDNWIVGDKTGTCDYGTTNDIAILWPPGCDPIVLGVFFTQPKKDSPPRDGAIQAATALTILEIAKQNACVRASIDPLSPPFKRKSTTYKEN